MPVQRPPLPLFLLSIFPLLLFSSSLAMIGLQLFGWKNTLPMPKGWSSPVGLSLGLASVAVGQVLTLAFFYYKRELCRDSNLMIQKVQGTRYSFWEGVRTHLGQPEGFVLLGSYLSLVCIRKECEGRKKKKKSGCRGFVLVASAP